MLFSCIYLIRNLSLGVTCPDLDVEFGEIQTMNDSAGPPYRFGDVVGVMCDDGFEAVNDTIMCTASGVWNTSAACEGVLRLSVLSTLTLKNTHYCEL